MEGLLQSGRLECQAINSECSIAYMAMRQAQSVPDLAHIQWVNLCCVIGRAQGCMQRQQGLQIWEPDSHAKAQPPVQALPGAKSGLRRSNSSALQNTARQSAAVVQASVPWLRARSLAGIYTSPNRRSANLQNSPQLDSTGSPMDVPPLIACCEAVNPILCFPPAQAHCHRYLRG